MIERKLYKQMKILNMYKLDLKINYLKPSREHRV